MADFDRAGRSAAWGNASLDLGKRFGPETREPKRQIGVVPGYGMMVTVDCDRISALCGPDVRLECDDDQPANGRMT